jgi:hypothetical protein
MGGLYSADSCASYMPFFPTLKKGEEKVQNNIMHLNVTISYPYWSRPI